MSGFSVPPTKWVFRKKPNKMYSTKRSVNTGIEKDHKAFNPQPKLLWLKGGFHSFTFFILILILGFIIAVFYFKRTDDMISRSQENKEITIRQINDNNEYLINNAEYEFLNGNFEAAKKDLDIVLKSNPQIIEANRLYLQTMIQLVIQYPDYREEAAEKTKECIEYLSDSEKDNQLMIVYNQVVLIQY